jgi:hypothetical protein
LPIPDLHFDREQYVAEVRRAVADRSWETPRRVTARLVADGLRTRGVILPPDLELRWVEPAGDGVRISFEGSKSGRLPFSQRSSPWPVAAPDRNRPPATSSVSSWRPRRTSGPRASANGLSTADAHVNQPLGQ